jgi:hypothetical protein
MIAESRDVFVRIMRGRRIFEIPLEECVKRTGIKIRVDNKHQILTISVPCLPPATASQGKTDSYSDELRTLCGAGEKQAPVKPCVPEIDPPRLQ